MTEKVLIGLFLALWADLRFAFWNLAKRLDSHIDGGTEKYAGPDRRKSHA